MLLKRILPILFCVFLSIVAAADPIPTDDLPQPLTFENAGKILLLSESKNHFVCAGIGVIDMGAVIDGPLFYFNEKTRKLISQCGGTCLVAHTNVQKEMCANLCPPPEWKANSCDDLRANWKKIKQ